MRSRFRSWRLLVASVAVIGGATAAIALVPSTGNAGASESAAARVFELTAKATTTTPIKHVVVIYDENVSFDHYFGTYPKATNANGEPFYAAPDTPSVNELTPALLYNNPNGINPKRLSYSPSGLLTCDENHNYTPEQYAFDGGKMDHFTAASGTATVTGVNPEGGACVASDVMNYYDGNTATAMWNYAQHFAMDDNAFDTDFGPSAPGAVNLVSGQTGGVLTADAVRSSLTDGDTVANGQGGYTLIGDAQPYFDDCSSRDAVALSGKNIGDQLNAKGLSWGWFEGGFTPSTAYTGAPDGVSTYNQLNEPGRVACAQVHNVGTAIGGNGTNYGTKTDYIPHHEPFQFYASTANPHHLQPTNLSVVGADTAPAGTFSTANHQYDVAWFNGVMEGIENGRLSASHFPAVSFLKAPGYEDGHQAYSDPVDEQEWLVSEINQIEALPTWSSTAIFITYDDSDGFYDHVAPPTVNGSSSTADVLSGNGVCGSGTPTLDSSEGRCGYGPRLPFVVISPYAKPNYVSHTLADQSSIIAFIEKNWNLGTIPGSFANVAGSVDSMFDFKTPAMTPALTLNPLTGEPNTPVVGTVNPMGGPISGGTKVTIDGINLTAKTKLYFGDTPARSVRCAPSKTLLAPASVCTAIAPATNAPGGVAIVATVGHHVAADDSKDFTYRS